MPLEFEQNRAYACPDDADPGMGPPRQFEIIRYSDLPGSTVRADVPLTNIPNQLNTIIGRAREAAELRQLLLDSRLVTLTGAGGVGKTQLALEVASELLWRYRDGVWFIDLAGVTDPARVTQTVASALDVLEETGRPLIDSLRDYLWDRQILLILDTCAHLIQTCATFVEALLGAAANLSFLVTSREPLRVPGEIIWPVAPLPVPDPGDLPSFETLLTNASVRLFVDRVATNQPEFVVTKENAPVVARICAHLDGLPLAIELAANRTRTLCLNELARRLEDGFSLLSSGHRTAPARHQTLQAALAWSFDLLSPPERLMLTRLSAFTSDWTLDVAEAVAAGNGVATSDVLPLVSALIDKSLVLVDLDSGGTARYRLLKSVRWYGQEQFRGSSEEGSLRRRYIEYFLGLAERAEEARFGPEQFARLDRLEREHHNLRTALEWSLNGEQVELGSRLAGALWHFWYRRNHLDEGRHWLDQAIALSSASETVLPARVRAKVLYAAAWLAYVRGDLNDAMEYGAGSLTFFRQAGDQAGVAAVLALQGLIVEHRGDLARAAAYAQQSLSLCRELGDRAGTARSLTCLGIVLDRQRDHNQAEVLLTEALAIQRDLGDLWGIAFSLGRLAMVGFRQRDCACATALLRESVALHRELGDWAGTAGDLEKLACVAVARGTPERSARLGGTASAIRDAIGAPVLPVDQADVESMVRASRAALGNAAFSAGWDAGRSLSAEEVIQEVLAEDGSSQATRLERGDPDAEAPPGDLTRREFEVAILVADGLTNREIAEKLTISARTVDTHVTHILRKQEFGCRSQIAAWIAEMRMPITPAR
jgi:non-specific serine/threonine protein kinase